ncbi:hypothetical protein KC347_g16 [Hortaea werneckii]|nr:hypothetical protein KC347_g16 [Hortaea werneckii]
MPATRPRASFEPISPRFDLKKLVEHTPNFSYVDRISCDMIDQQGLAAFEKLVLLHVIMGGKPLVIDGFEDRLDPWTFSPKWLRDNCGDKVENARVLASQENLPLTMGHYLKNMGKLTNQFFEKPDAYKEKSRQRVYLKDIDCPGVWQDKLKEQIPSTLWYLNESTGDANGPGTMPDPTGNAQGRKQAKGIARAGDLMSSLPPDMRAENLMCYIGHEGTYTPSHREMCASLGQNIMVEASDTVSDDGKAERPGSSIWFMTETKDRHIVSEYWLSVLGHDIEVENHFAQIVAWKKAPFNVYVVEQRPGDFILIPPLAPHQVWNRGTRTMKVAWNRTTAETLEMALNEALPRSRIVCRDEQYKNKAIVYYTLQKYSNLLALAQQQAAHMPTDMAQQLLYTGKVKQLQKDFKKLFSLFKQIMLSEMFNPEDRDAPKSIEYLPFDSNVTCAYCRSNIFNRFLTCPSCKDLLGHDQDGEGDPYDVCMDCYAMGRSCACISGHKWVEQFRWRELATKYDAWRKQIIQLDGNQVTEKTPQPLLEERRRYGKKTLAEVCKDQLKRRPFKDVHAPANEPKNDEEDDEEIVVGDDGTVKKVAKKKCPFAQNVTAAGVMGHCFVAVTRCQWRSWRILIGPVLIVLVSASPVPKVADVRSVEALVDFSLSNLNWLRDDNAVDRTQSNRVKRARAEAEKAKEADANLDDEEPVDQTQVDYEYSPEDQTPIDPALTGDESVHARRDDEDEDAYLMRRLQQENALPPPSAMVAGAPVSGSVDGYAPVAPQAHMYPAPGEDSAFPYPDYARPMSVEPAQVEEGQEGTVNSRLSKRQRGDDEEDEDDFDNAGINMQKHPKAKKPKLSAAGFKSSDLADGTIASKAKNEAQRQFEKEKERKALDRAKAEGRFIMLSAALRNKKRIVKLKVTGARLAHLVAQQATSATLEGASEEADADHDIEDEQQDKEDQDDEASHALLTSDIRPKHDPKLYYQQRERDGFVVTSKTKKALVPIEKDDNYGYDARVRLPNGKRVRIATDPEQRQKRKTRQSHVEYEEVDIGSDEERDQEALAPGGNHSDGFPEKDRRSLPGYLQNRHAGEASPQGLPPRKPRSGNVNQHQDDTDNHSRTRIHSEDVDSDEPTRFSGPGGRPAGKRPSMRPAASTHAVEDNIDDDNVVNQVIDDFMDVDDTVALSKAAVERAITATTASEPSRTTTAKSSAGRKPPTGRPRGRPSKVSLLQAEQKARIAEENRLAKLQALEMSGIDIGSNTTGTNGVDVGPRGATGLAEPTSDPESDDVIDSIPAKHTASI